MTRIMPAEWAPQSAVQLTFPHAGTDWRDMLDAVNPVFIDIATAIARFQKVVVVCEDARHTREMLKHIPDERLVLAELPSNDTWARDHGGITVIAQGQLVVLDFLFTGWGLKFPADKDNRITGRLHQLGIIRVPCVPGGLALEGGAIESDGDGTIMTTSECLLSPNRNPHLNRAQTEAALRTALGADRVLWLDDGALEGDDTDAHIDTLARFCAPDTIAYVRCDNPKDAHYAAFQRMEASLMAFRQANGAPYKLVPLPWPDPCYAQDDGRRLPATYANFLIINGAVLMPTYGVPQDAEALQTIGSLFPGREVIGINCRPLIEQHGSLHCITMQYPEGVI